MSLSRPVSRYAGAVAVTAAAVALRIALRPYFGTTVAYITFYPAVMLVATFGGLGPGLVTTAASAACAAYWILPAHPGAAVPSPALASLAVFTLMGAAISAVAGLHDRSRRRLADLERAAALRESEERLRTLGDNLPAGAIYRYQHDAGGRPRFLHISRGIEALTGVSPREILADASAFHDTLRPEDRARLATEERISREALTAFELEVRVSHRVTGQERWALLRSVPTRLPDGTTAWDGIHLDITERKHAEDALRQADRRKDEFLGMLSHELRNPLAPIRNALYLLDRADPSGDGARRAREVLGRQVGHLTRLVDDLLDVTRIGRGKIELRRADVDLAALVLRTADDHRALMEARGLALEVDAGAEAVVVSGDEVRLAQVLGNLLSNARKFTPAGGRVTIALRRDGERAVLRVRDTGPGVSPELLPSLFAPFAQGKQTLARSEGGLGLGLALVKGLVELHRGEVEVAGGDAGRGAEFAIRLPLAERARQPAAAARRAGRAAPVRRRVLVVDDNRDGAETLAELVAAMGHDAEVAFDGPTALAKARARPPEVVLCDLGLPGMDGYAVAKALRSAGLPGLKLVAVSGYAQPEDVRLAVEAGFDVHVAKPPPSEEIARLLT
jgi:PAS domain S-box-containing protein